MEVPKETLIIKGQQCGTISDIYYWRTPETMEDCVWTCMHVHVCIHS